MQTVLITGGTGFLGRHLAASLRRDHHVFLGGRNSNQNAMAREATGCPVLPLDVTNMESVRDAFREVRPDIVIHAAAMKYVDLAEKFPLDCIDINVTGSQNVARVAMDSNVAVVVGISTDKAAPPIMNTYGLSKALMERMFCSLNGKTKSKFCCVRFGNLAWSTGSVLPIWKKMHDDTGVIGSTGPEMRRLICSVDDAVQLVRTAIERADTLGGKVISRRMKAAQIEDLLNTWTRHKGGRWERITARPGDRCDEALIGDIEVPFTAAAEHDGVEHYVISFDEKAKHPIASGLSSKNAERLSEREMLDIIDNPVE